MFLNHSKRNIFRLLTNFLLKNTMEGPVACDSSTEKPKKQSRFLCLSPLELNKIKTPVDRPFRVSIEGNIGAGKSTLIKYFERFPEIETYPEALDKWRNLNGHNMLDLLYSDSEKWINVFQNYVQLTRLKVQTETAKSAETRVQMYERSLQNNRFCFMENAFKTGILEAADYDVLNEWYHWIQANIDIGLNLIVYLRSSPEVVYERVKSRARPEEAGITLEFLKELHESHETWLMSDDLTMNSIPVLVLNADKTLEEITAEYQKYENQILGYEKRGVKRVQQEEKTKVKKSLNL